ncbi:adenylate cyclase [Acrasis kona]|uniref:Adenylate cyclase n=1 Tax=Acrasis kona TaxID=1008807 RepID=A0AAW2YTI4_9EUKA
MMALSLLSGGKIINIKYDIVATVMSAFIASSSVAVAFIITSLQKLVIPFRDMLRRHAVASCSKYDLKGGQKEKANILLDLDDKSKIGLTKLFVDAPATPRVSELVEFTGAVRRNSAMSHASRYVVEEEVSSSQELIVSSDLESLSKWGALWLKIRPRIFGDDNLPHIVQILFAAVFTTTGVGAMHYYGMTAMQQSGLAIIFNPGVVIASLIIAYVASVAALWLCYNLEKEWQQLGSAVVMAIAVCGMHYTGMAGASYILDTSRFDFEQIDGVGGLQLLFYVTLCTCIVCFIMIIIISSCVSRDRSSLRLLNEEINNEKEKSEHLLLNILPQEIANKIKLNNSEMICEEYESVTVVFSDIVKFTTISENATPTILVTLLHGLFSRFDDVLMELGLEKIKTIGDAYMAVAGLPTERKDHAEIAVKFGLGMIRVVREFNQFFIGSVQSKIENASMKDLSYRSRVVPMLEETRESLQIRVGMNTGKVVAGVIGSNKFCFDIYGDAVNVASRMESFGVPMRVNMSPSTYELVKDMYSFEERSADVKGKGRMSMYLLVEQ